MIRSIRTLFCLITLLLPAFAAFSQTPGITGNISFCHGSSTTLTAPAGSSYQWQSGATASGPWTDVGSSQTLVITTGGFYQVIVTDATPTSTTYSAIVTENSKPDLGFTFNNDRSCAGTPIQFTTNISGGSAPFAYAWTFGDGGSAIIANPIHGFLKTGCIDAPVINSLIVTDANGCADTIAHTLTVLPKPEVALQDDDVFNPFSNCQNSPTSANPTYTLKVNNISASASCITSYSINWGDGNVQSGITNASFPLSHTYTQLGAFSLTISGTGANGCSNATTYTVANQSNPAGGLGTQGNTTNLCANADVPFIISNWENNSPGTIYVLDYGDGLMDTLQHPLSGTPGAYTKHHLYEKSSCPQSSFTATLNAINACYKTPYTAGNIQIRIKPMAEFTPVTTACVNKSVCFTNSSTTGYTGNNCSTQSLYKWNFGDPSSGSNTSTAENGCHIYTTPGTYTVTMEASNPCGTSTATHVICVVPEPTPAFTLDNTTGCGTLNVTATNTSNTLTGCSTPAYSWSISYTAANCGNSAAYSFTNSTDAASLNPSFRFSNPGKYTITLTITNACGAFSTSKEVSVKSRPTVSVNTINDICAGTTIHPGAFVTNCATNAVTYAWSFTGGTPSSAATLDPGNITYSSAAGYTVKLEATNECGTASDSKIVTVKPVPTVTVPATASICTGALAGAFVFSSTPSGAISWTNNNTNIGLGSSGSGNINAFSTTNATSLLQTATITVQSNVNNCTATNTFDINVYPKVNAPTVATPVNYCTGATATPLTATATGSNALLWYTGPSGGPGSATAPTPATATPGTTDYYVSQQSAPANCESPRTLLKVIVNPVPAFTATASNPSQCSMANGLITLSGLANNTSYKVDYTQNTNPVSQNIVSNNAGILTIGNLGAGTYDHITVTASGCSSSEAGPFTLVDPSPPATPVVGNNGPLCSGNTINLSASTTGIGTAVWSWAGPNGYTSTAANPAIANAAVTDAGSYTVRVSINNCTSAPASTTVIIHPSPAKPVVGSNSPICSGNTLNLTASSDAGVSYEWTGPNSFTSTDQSPSINSAQPTASGTYTVKATLGTCSSSNTITVRVNLTPVINKATAINPTSCASSTGAITLEGLTASTTYSITYNKNGTPVTSSITTTASGNAILPNLTTGTYEHIRVKVNNCESNEVGPFVLTDPTPPATPTVSNDGAKCEGSTLQLSATSITNATYAWSGPNGFTSGIANPVITNVTIAAAGTYTLVIKVKGCSSPTATTVATVYPTPVITSASGSSPICTGNSIQLNASTGFSDPFNWSWTGPNGFTAATANPTISNATLAAGGTYTVSATAVTGNCASQPKSVIVRVDSTPAIGTITKDDPTACNSSTGKIYINGLQANTAFTVYYQYNGHAASSALSSNAAGTLTISGLAAGIYEHIYVTALNCPSNEAGPITLTDPNPPAIPAVGSNSPLCAEGTLHLTAQSATPGAVSYQWTGPNSFNSTQQNPDITAVSAAHAGTYAVKAILNNCASGAATVAVVVNPLGAIPTVSTPVVYCKDNTATPLSVTPVAGTTLKWYTTATGTVSSLTPPTPDTHTPGTVNYYISQTTTAGCEGPRATIEVITNPDAIADFAPTVTTSCAPFVLTPAIIHPTPYPVNNSAYEWYANGVLIGSSSAFPGYTLSQENDSMTIQLKTISRSGCKDDSLSHRFYTYPLPHTAFTVNTNEGCGPLTVQLNNTTPDQSQFQFKWDFGNGTTSTAAQPGSVLLLPNPSYGDTVYIITLSAYLHCDTIKATQSILVKSKPKALFTPAQSFGCSPFTNSFTNTSKGHNLSFTWNFDDGTIRQTTSMDTLQHRFITGVQDTFHVKLTATNECGTDEQSYAIVVSPNKINLNLAINGNERTGCQPLTVHFINNTSGANGFHWNFGDGNVLNTIKNIDTVTHVFQQAGFFTISLAATNGCSDTSTTVAVQVFAKPKAAFTAPATACLAEQVSFVNQTDTATSFTWQFADGTASLVKDPSYAFTAPGAYQVKLIAVLQYATGNTCTDSVTHPVVVGPTGTLTHDHGYICGSTPVRFEVAATNADSIRWNFGDGHSQVTTAHVIYHTYSQAGNYLPVVTLLKGAHCFTPILSTDTIKVDYVSAGFTSIAQQYCDSTKLPFTDTSRTFYGIQSWSWNLGNGQGSTLQHPAAVYKNTGTYPVVLKVTAWSGCTATQTIQLPVKVNNRPIAAIDAAVKGCTLQPVTYKATVNSTDPVSIYQWSFSDNAIATGVQVSHTYTTALGYTAQLITGTTFGCYDTVSQFIRVYTTPVVTAGEDKLVCRGKSIALAASGAATYSWSPIDGTLNCTNCPRPVAQPYSTTQYIVEGTSTDGCSAQDTLLVTVAQPLDIHASDNVTICIEKKTQLSVTGATHYVWSPAATLDAPVSANPIASPKTTTTYQVIGFDAYQCFQDTAYTTVTVGLYPVIQLGPDTVLATGTLYPLRSNVANGPIAQWQWAPSIDLSCSDCPQPVATIKKNTCFIATGTNGSGCTSADTVCVKVFCENTQVYIPNMFTPDNDGHNDKLIVRGKGIVQVKSFRIFNRWGQVVFERNNFSPNDPGFGWDGTVKGTAAPPDVYVYTCEVVCENGTPYTYKGNVAIIK